MIVSFTGTQKGMTVKQRDELRQLLIHADGIVHGACIGADDEADLIACELGIHREVFPSTVFKKRVSDAVLLNRGPVTLHVAKPPLERNPDIVAAGDCLIACPKEPQEIQYSGTWTTVRHARRQGKPVQVIEP